MKKLLQIALLALISAAANAAVINVSNSPTAPLNPPHTYNNLQTAVTAAVDGDSLYVHGTNISYGDVTVTNKTLTFIGAGYGSNLQSNFQQRTIISNLIFSGYTGTKNIVLTGILIEADVYNNAGNAPVNNLVIDRCAMNKLTCTSNNLIVRQSLFENDVYHLLAFTPTVLGNAIIQNSVFCGRVGPSMQLGSSLWENNIFKLSYDYYDTYGNLSNINGTAIFKNNIFNDGYTVNTVSNCTFNNNVFASVGSLTNGNAGTGNVFSALPGFVNNAYAKEVIGKVNYCSAVNYHVTTGSAADTAGAGSTQIGIYGGTNALPVSAVLNGVPAMPRITEMNLQNISVSPTGNISVQLKAVKED